MTKLTTFIIAILVVLILGFYMVTFQVRYDEVAVLTTFEKAEAPTETSQGSLRRQPGLYLKAPWPFQKVKRYSKRLHVLEDQLQEIKTADDKSVIAMAYVAWRIDDPYAFWKRVQTVQQMEQFLLVEMSTINAVIGEHDFDQLVNTDASKLALDQIEAEAAKRIRAQIAPAGYGIEIESVGIRRLLLPEKVTETVFERMKSDRTRRAESLLAEGEAEAGRIVKEAESKRDRIMAFAKGRAEAIEALGAEDARKTYRNFEKDENLAIFLRQMRALEEMLGYNSTFVFRADELDLLQMFKHGPSVVTDPQTGLPKITTTPTSKPEGE